MADLFQPSCTVVIPTRDRPAGLDRCLEAVSRLDYPRFDTLVVDNAPSNDLARQVAARWGAQYLLEPVVGVSRARNSGARACATEIVAYLDDDAVPERGWLKALAAEFQDPLLMAAAGRQLPLDCAPASDAVGPFLPAPDRGLDRRRLDSQTPSWFEMAAFGAIGDGCNMAIRRKAFDLWPGFDERLCRGAPISGSGDNHAFATLIETGYAALYTPYAVVHHRGPLTLQEARTNELEHYRSAAAYATLLLVESRHRWEVLRYLVLGQIGGGRGWRGPSKPMASRLRIFFACLPAPFLYLQSCIGRSRSGTASTCPLPPKSPTTPCFSVAGTNPGNRYASRNCRLAFRIHSLKQFSEP